MRFTLTATMAALMLAVTAGSIASAEEESLETAVKKKFERLGLTSEDIHNPIIKRIDELTWDDQEIVDVLKALPEKARENYLKTRQQTEDQQNRLPYTLLGKIKLKYLDDGGAVLPMADEPTPWIHAAPQPIVSLGLMPCYNSMEEAQEIAKETNKPILVISTELPGCSACVGHGHNQLSHPFVVDAALEFVPVVVSGGWPYLQVLDAEGQPISERVNHKSSIGDTLKMMRDALHTAKREVPDWLELVTDEYTVKRETTAFAMSCFWSGESNLGKLAGVISTRVGIRENKGEWVEVDFDPTVVSYEQLVKSAAEMKCAYAIVARSDEQAKIARDFVSSPERLYRDDESLITPTKYPHDDKHSIVKSQRYGYLPMTPAQATRINALGKEGEQYLAPSQLVFIDKVAEHMSQGEAAAELPKPDWTAMESLESDARALQAELEMIPVRAW